jgi:hypothetical protein
MSDLLVLNRVLKESCYFHNLSYLVTAKTRLCHRSKTHVTELCQDLDLEAGMLCVDKMKESTFLSERVFNFQLGVFTN